MKNYIIITFLTILSFNAQAQLETPALSSSAAIKQTIGLTDIEIIYSRPSVKGRVIFGENSLLSYGSNWRFGANNATTFIFSRDIHIGGVDLKKGTYTVIAVPGISIWELKWYEHDNDDWTSYIEKTPIAISKIPPTVSSFVETFEMSFKNVTMETAELRIVWERMVLEVPIKVPTISQTRKNIENTMTGPSLDDYFQAAVFLHETNTELSKALSYIKKVTASDYALFFVVTREAQILRDLEMNTEALAAAKKALKLSKKAQNDDFIKINQDIITQLE